MSNISQSFLSRISSRKFLLALLAAGIAFGNYMWDWGLTVREVQQVLLPLFAFIGIEGFKDLIK